MSRRDSGRLFEYIECAGATPDPVLPYGYVSEAEHAHVLSVIADMAAGRLDAIAFTSAPSGSPIMRRGPCLRPISCKVSNPSSLRRGGGPIVASELEALGGASEHHRLAVHVLHEAPCTEPAAALMAPAGADGIAKGAKNFE